jgi:hypothetical protein
MAATLCRFVPMAMVLAGCASAALRTEAVPAPATYSSMAPIEQYREASVPDEVTLARSAAPPSVSDGADVLVLGERGYTAAAKGTNGFVCVVERAWAMDFDAAEFWNPKVRAPICFNQTAARSVLPAYLERTEWVLAGVPVAEMVARTKAAIASSHIGPPEIGSMCFMMSKRGHLNDADGQWHPHIMYFLPRTKAADWGANMPGSPLFAQSEALAPVTIFMSPVRKWSDGTADTSTM